MIVRHSEILPSPFSELSFNVAIMFPLELNPTCEGCDSIELKQELKRNYGVRVCQKCYESDREKYKQITKTQAKEVSNRYVNVHHKLIMLVGISFDRGGIERRVFAASASGQSTQKFLE